MRSASLSAAERHAGSRVGYTALRRLVENPDHRVIVAFGGGSLPGLAGNVALAAVLEELGLRHHVAQVWGTSAGAVIGAAFAAGRSPDAMLELIESVGRQPRPGLPRAVLGCLLALLRRRRLPDGLLPIDRFAAAIDAGVGVATFEQCRVAFRCLACADDGHGTRHVFRRGPLLPAILASMSLPGIFAHPAGMPAKYRCFYDGGMVEKTPLLSPIAEHDRSGDPRTLVILATHFGPRRKGERARGFVDRFLHSIDVLEDRLWLYQLLEARARRDVRLILLEPATDGGMLDFTRVRENFEAARVGLRAALGDAQLALAVRRVVTWATNRSSTSVRSGPTTCASIAPRVAACCTT